MNLRHEILIRWKISIMIASERSPSAAAQPPRLGAAEGALSHIGFLNSVVTF